jgi:hypothetical protein
VSTAPLLPQAFWFRLAARCQRLDAVPRTRGRLLGLPDTFLLPQGSRLDDKPTWADVGTAWNPGGLAISVEVTGKLSALVHDPYQSSLSDRVHLWIDTRDTRNVHRATRFCHGFTAELIPSKRSSEASAKVTQTKIHRAQADAPDCEISQIQTRVELIRKGWRLELFFPAATLHGYDPETNRRLGFYYQVTDGDRGDQFLMVGRDFPIGEDPSLWATLELTDG